MCVRAKTSVTIPVYVCVRVRAPSATAEARAMETAEAYAKSVRQAAQESNYMLWTSLTREQAKRRENHDRLEMMKGPVRVCVPPCVCVGVEICVRPLCLCLLRVLLCTCTYVDMCVFVCLHALCVCVCVVRYCRIRPLTSSERARNMSSQIRSLPGGIVESVPVRDKAKTKVCVCVR